MIFELTILLLISALILSLLKLYTNIFDNFWNDDGLWTECGELTIDKCQTPEIHMGNCRVFNLGGNRNQSSVCRQSGIAMGAFGNSRIIRS